MSPPYLAVLDVGHGNCAVVVADGRVTVIDAGAKGCSLRQFLIEQGITHLDAVVLSHADADHIGGVLRVLSKPEFQVNAVYVNPAPGRTTAAWGDLVSAAREYESSGMNVLAGNVDQNLNARLASTNVSIQVLAPTAADVAAQKLASQPAGFQADTNTLSAVIRVLAFGHPVALLCGDIDQPGFDALAGRQPSIPTPLLVFPHHGGRVGATGDANAAATFASALCTLSRPDVVLFSIGKPFANPLPEVVASVRTSRPNAWIACTQLSKHCGPIQGSTTPGHWAPIHARGRAKAECCLGSLIVQLSAAGPSFQPARQAHEAFIQLRVSTPLCQAGPTAVSTGPHLAPPSTSGPIPQPTRRRARTSAAKARSGSSSRSHHRKVPRKKRRA